MMIPSNYYINVSKPTMKYPNGIHFCKIELGDVSEAEAKKAFEEIKAVFGDIHYKLNLYHVTCYGTPM